MKLLARYLQRRLLIVLALGFIAGCMSNETSATGSAVAVLRGMVYNASRMPVLDMKVSLRLDGKQTTSALTDIHGRYYIPDVPFGPVTLRFTKEGYEPLDWSFSFERPTQVVYVQVVNMNELLDRTAELIQKRNWKDAASWLERVRKMDPDNMVAVYLEAEMLSRQGKPEEAAVMLENLSSGGDPSFAVELSLADLYQNKLDQPEKALPHLKRALMIQDDIDVEKRIEAIEKN